MNIVIRDDLTGKFYASREELDADRKKNASEIFALLEPRIIKQIDDMTDEQMKGFKEDKEGLKAQNLAVLRYKLGLDSEESGE